MSIENRQELEATREKLRLLEEHYEEKRKRQGGDPHVRELTLRSLRRMINELKENIIRFESHAAASSESR